MFSNLHVFVISYQMSTKKGQTGIRYFSEEGSGFKITPKTVLIMSLIYIGIVVLLHIYAKLGGSKVSTTPSTESPQGEQATPEPAQASESQEARDIP